MGSLLLLTPQQSTGRLWKPCARTYAANLCGIYLPNLPLVPGGASNPELVLSWFLDRYSLQNQTRILEGYRERSLTDVILSWPDSRAVGATPEGFGSLVSRVYQSGFEPTVMLTSKVYDGSTLEALKAAVAPVLPWLIKRCGRFSVGWELNLFLQPDVLQQFIDWLAPQITPWGGKLYVHFSPGYFAWQPDGGVTADFWNRNRGQLTGIFHQRVLEWDMAMYQARIVDCLERFAGRFGFSTDSGFGHPWDFIAWEINAETVFYNNMSETEQGVWADDALSVPPVLGPLGDVRVMGSGNGLGKARPSAAYAVGMNPSLSGATLPAHPHM